MEQLEPLGNDFGIYVNKNHRFGTDAVLLANFSMEYKINTACDLGTGCGIIPMLWIKSNAVKNAFGVEIQADGCELAKKTISHFGLQDRFSVVNSDLKELKGKLPFGSFDLVTCNPPYKAPGAGITNPDESSRLARHETLCTFSDIAKAASELLKFSGRFCVCQRPERLADIFCEMRKVKIEPKRLRLIVQRSGQEPWLVLVEGRLGSKSGMRIMPPLYVETDGKISEEMKKIYGDYVDGKGRYN